MLHILTRTIYEKFVKENGSLLSGYMYAKNKHIVAIRAELTFVWFTYRRLIKSILFSFRLVCDFFLMWNTSL